MATVIPNEARLLDIKDLAAAFECHQRTLERRLAELQIPVIRVSKHKPSIRQRDLARLLVGCEED